MVQSVLMSSAKPNSDLINASSLCRICKRTLIGGCLAALEDSKAVLNGVAALLKSDGIVPDNDFGQTSWCSLF